MITSKLIDKKNLAPELLDELDKKLSSAKANLALNPAGFKGGMPFVYAFAATKEHHLDDCFPSIVDKDTKEETKQGTAATDGKVYKWFPAFLKKLTVFETIIVIAHETYHIVMQHCNPNRCFGKDLHIWNLAIDYVVNGAIEHDLIQNNHVQKEAAKKSGTDKSVEHPIWTGNFGKPTTLKQLLEQIDQMGDDKKNGVKRKQPKDIEPTVFADYSLYGRSAESIYEEIMNALRKNGLGGDLDDVLRAMGLDPSTLDQHEKIEISRGKLLEEIMSAATSARKMAGNLPGAIADELAKLEEPKLKWQDLVKHAFQKIRQDNGRYNDWSRFRRRGLALDLWHPRKKDETVRWLCMLDTSGSMSNEDIAYGISQLKCLDHRSRGIVVPCDAQPYWKDAVDINCAGDLIKVRPVGRSGTIFDEFFRDYRTHIKGQIDLIICITDGYVSLDPQYKPPVDTVFVITNEHLPQLPFGRIAPLRSF